MKFYVFYLLAVIASTLYLTSILKDMTKADCAYGVQSACTYLEKINKEL